MHVWTDVRCPGNSDPLFLHIAGTLCAYSVITLFDNHHIADDDNVMQGRLAIREFSREFKKPRRLRRRKRHFKLLV